MVDLRPLVLAAAQLEVRARHSPEQRRWTERGREGEREGGREGGRERGREGGRERGKEGKREGGRK